jgi:hypothetical protein
MNRWVYVTLAAGFISLTAHLVWNKATESSSSTATITSIDSLRMQASKGSGEAMFQLYLVLQEAGKSSESYLWLEKSANVGHSAASIHYFDIATDGVGELDRSKAIQFIQRNAIAGDKEACHRMAIVTTHNAKNLGTQEERWFKCATEEGPSHQALPEAFLDYSKGLVKSNRNAEAFKVASDGLKLVPEKSETARELRDILSQTHLPK